MNKFPAIAHMGIISKRKKIKLFGLILI